jgi:dTMP kinase
MIRFISFEGGDGCGKSTQLRLLERHLTGRGIKCFSTREPGGTRLGKMIRQILLQTGEQDVSRSTELFLYLADRAQHVSEVIQPALDQGRVVLCDRFVDSTVAYQGYGRGIELAMLRRFNEVASRGIGPDLTFLLDCPAETGLSRTRQRLQPSLSPSPGDESRLEPPIEGPDRFESERIDFHERVREGFLDIARLEPWRVHVIDGARSIQEVHEQIVRIVDAKLQTGQ